ncbi:hypothetical protein KC717_07090 [Candidatus Dojkabacteria bacterium]|uniref:Uncharacterized protein n=1 Tax=Candidatus Dojkabacteria bacterium TaxID=2099670 RepID=A0A955RL09_9BACT|nr:hypothetical protein [Candidatus Dojkabacteria bacterium]
MKQTKYIVTFRDGSSHTVYAYYMAAGVILAQAKQIEKSKSIIPIKVVEFLNKTNRKVYSPVYHFKAHEIQREMRTEKMSFETS